MAEDSLFIGGNADPLPSMMPLKVFGEPRIVINLVSSGKDLADDLGCVFWKKNQTDPPIGDVMTHEVGVDNAQKINDALNQGFTIGDKHGGGRFFPVASNDPAKPYAIRIPPGWGGVFYGNGWGARGEVPSGGTDFGTHFVCTTNPAVVPYSEQEVIRCDGIWRWIGPFGIIGRYVSNAGDGWNYLQNNQIAAIGFVVNGPVPFSALITGSLALRYCVNGIVFRYAANAHWHRLTFRRVKYCYVSKDIQSIPHHIDLVDTGPEVGTVFYFEAGGSLYVRYCSWDLPARLLHLVNPIRGSRRFEIHGIKGDSQMFKQDSSPVVRAYDILGRPSSLLHVDEPTTGNPNRFYTVRISGEMTENPHNWFKDLRMVYNRGRSYDVEIDFEGLPEEEMTAYARKHSPISNPTAFTLPDVGLQSDFSPPAPSKVAGWWDMSRSDLVNSGSPADGDVITQLKPKFGETGWILTGSTPDAPKVLNDGIHHRRALSTNVSSNPQFLTIASPSPARHVGGTQLEVWIVGAQRYLTSTQANEPNWISAWNTGASNRCWRIGFVRNETNHHGKIRAWLLFNASGSDYLMLQTEEPLGYEHQALVILRYNGTSSRIQELDPGQASLTVNGKTVYATRDGGPVALYASSSPIRIGSDGWTSYSGCYIAEAAILDQLSTFTLGTDSESGATPDTGELVTIRKYFRRKYGVW